MAEPLVHAARSGVSHSLSCLSARARRLALIHRCPHRPLGRLYWPRKLRMAVDRLDILALSVQYAALYDRRQYDKIRCRTLPRAVVEREPALQGDPSRPGAGPVHRADRAVRHRVLVAVRSAILDHFVVAQKN